MILVRMGWNGLHIAGNVKASISQASTYSWAGSASRASHEYVLTASWSMMKSLQGVQSTNRGWF